MKKRCIAVVTMALLSCVFMFGCSSTSKADPIVGTWKFDGPWAGSEWPNTTLEIKDDGTAILHSEEGVNDNGDIYTTLLMIWQYPTERENYYFIRGDVQPGKKHSVSISFELVFADNDKLVDHQYEYFYLTRQ